MKVFRIRVEYCEYKDHVIGKWKTLEPIVDQIWQPYEFEIMKIRPDYKRFFEIACLEKINNKLWEIIKKENKEYGKKKKNKSKHMKHPK